MRIFVTGGTGFIGSHVLSKAVSSGHEVVAIRRPGATPRINLNIQPYWINGDLSSDYFDLLETCDAFIHWAAYGVAQGHNDWKQCFEINTINSAALWQQAACAGVRNFIIVGSCFEYGLSGERYDYIPATAPLEPTSAYAASKASATMAAIALRTGHLEN